MTAHAVQLLLPQPDRPRRRVHRARAGPRIGEVHVLVPVVEAPVGGQLHQRPRRRLEHVWLVVVHERRVVVEAVLGEEVERARARLPARRAVALRPEAEAVERRQAGFEIAALLRFVHAQRAQVAVAVVADLVPGSQDPLDGLGDSAPPSSRGRRTSQEHRDRRAARGCAARRRAARNAGGSSRSGDRRTGAPRRESPTRRRRRTRGWRAPRSTRARTTAHSRTCLFQITLLLTVPATELCQF